MAAQVKDLLPNPKNPRRISKEKKELFEKSLKEYGPLYGVVHNRQTGFLVGGHQTGSILGPDAQITVEETFDPPTETGTVARGYIMLDGEKITYRQVDFSPEKEAGAMVAANRGAGAWDFAKLSELFIELDHLNFDLDLTMFDAEERENIVVPVTHVPPAGDPDNCPEPPKEPTSKRGDIYLLGTHQLMCGDACSIDDVQKLVAGEVMDMVWTDPPYNVAYEGKTKDKLTIQNDQMEKQDFKEFLRTAFSNMALVTKPGGAIYVAHADTEGVNFRTALVEAGFLFKQCLVWVKQQFVMGRQDYHWKHEPILYGWKDGDAHHWYGDRKQSTVLQFDRPHRSTEHPTTKPIDLITYMLNQSSKQGHTVLDLFGGSGSTLIACEMTGRQCFTMELDPRYVDVIIRRYEELTGKKAELLRSE